MLETTPKGRLLVTGSLAWDFILGYPGYLQDSLAPLRHQDHSRILLAASQLDCHPGGCGGNICYTLALLGEQPRLLSIAGCDFGPYRQKLASAGVDLSRVVEIPDQHSASCVILTDSMQNRVVAFYGGATDRASELDLGGALDPGIAACLIAPDDGPAMLTFAEQARKAGIPFIFDVGSQVTGLAAEDILLAIVGARVVLCNDYELSIFESKTGWTLQRLLEVVPVVVVTLGDQGSLIHQQGQDSVRVPSVPLLHEAVDSTGAGDAYRAGFAAGWIRDLPWEVCGRLGSVAAAFVVEARGTQGHHFTLEQFLARYQDVFGEN